MLVARVTVNGVPGCVVSDTGAGTTRCGVGGTSSAVVPDAGVEGTSAARARAATARSLVRCTVICSPGTEIWHLVGSPHHRTRGQALAMVYTKRAGGRGG